MHVPIGSLLKGEIGDTQPVSIRLDHVPTERLQDFSQVEVIGTLTKLADRLLFKGRVTASVELECARCLEPYKQNAAAEFTEEYAAHPVDEQFGYHGDELNLEPLLTNHLNLAVPIRPLHDPDCKGLCMACGKNLNTDPHGHKAGSKPNPFSELRKLKK